MKIIFSPLVAGFSGKTAHLVGASWKGIAYVRKLVTPANPQTAAQTAVRDSLTRCVELWRSLDAKIKAWLDEYAVDYRMSGYNTFMSKCRADEQTPALLTVVPANPHVDAVSTLAFATGAGVSGDIDCTWVDNAPAGCTLIAIVVRDDATNRFEGYVTEAKASCTKVIGGLDPAKTYDCYAFWTDAAETYYGTCDGDLGIAPKA